MVREVFMYAPGWIEGVPYVGGFPGNCIVRLNEANEVVEIVPMGMVSPEVVPSETPDAPIEDSGDEEKVRG